MEHITYGTLQMGEEILRTLAEQTRLRLVRLLLASGESCVCELIDALQLPQYAVSRHLSALKRAGIVTERRDGSWRHYSVNFKPNSFLGKLLSLIETGLNEESLEGDLARFRQRLALRVDGKCIVGIVNKCSCSNTNCSC